MIIAMFFAITSHAHLCNDVFAQAKDNLAVKVDIRDGQLRIGKEASFRVYLLNTMDRGIVTIKLDVESPQFEATVKPGEGWDSFPALKTTAQGGKKEYFDVTLKRKAGVADGKYKINLKLYNGKDASMVFKTVDLESAAALHSLPISSAISINGTATEAEWKNAVICSDFYEYEKKGSYFENKRIEKQPRFRVAADKDNIYCMLNFPADAKADSTVSIFVAADHNSKPAEIKIDKTTGNVTADTGTSDIVVKKSSTGTTLECKLPRSSVNIEPGKPFLMNFAIADNGSGNNKVAYWRGNKLSLKNPLVYDSFILPN
jgi:hypothetical protein